MTLYFNTLRAQGCPDGPGPPGWSNHPDNHDTAGWHHTTSTDFVHFTNLGIPKGLSAVNETYHTLTHLHASPMPSV
jgi:hypothetical protein